MTTPQAARDTYGPLVHALQAVAQMPSIETCSRPLVKLGEVFFFQTQRATCEERAPGPGLAGYDLFVSHGGPVAGHQNPVDLSPPTTGVLAIEKK